ncbi:MAG: cysteine desulfurase family protein [Candidatus Neomarinimicrobiota bacterium]
MLYFDYCATTPLDERVAKLMVDLNGRVFGNPSSVHRFGQEARAYVENARRQLAKSIHCEPSEIIFTGSGSEANNLALWNILQGEKKHMVTSPVEHPSVADTVARLKEFGISGTMVDVDSHGLVNPADISKAIRKDETGLVTVMMANNETGTLEPVREIAEICTEAGIWFHSDAVQALGKIPVDAKEPDITSMSFSAHKLYGPKGVGALYLKKGVRLHPHIVGGGQEQRMRGGTENVAGICGFALAAELATGTLREEGVRLDMLRDLFVNSLRAEFPQVVINGHPGEHLPGVVNITVPGISGDALLMNLDLDGLAVSTGSACSSGSARPSRVLKVMGIPDDLNLQSLRISFGRYTQEEDVATLVDVLCRHMRNLSNVAQEVTAA